MEKLGKIEPGSMVIDMDDVLTFTTNYWFNCIVKNIKVFEPYINMNLIPKNYSYDKDFYYPLTRPTYNFGDWLCRKDLSNEDYLVARGFIMEAYFREKTFYQYVMQTPLVNALIDMFNYNHFKFNKIYIVTRTFEEFMNAKKDCIKKLFLPIIKDVEIIFTGMTETKSESIKDIEKVSLIIDDELSNIYDYIDHSNNIDNALVVIPMTGYNTPFSKEYLEKAKEKNLMIKYYNFKK